MLNVNVQNKPFVSLSGTFCYGTFIKPDKRFFHFHVIAKRVSKILFVSII